MENEHYEEELQDRIDAMGYRLLNIKFNLQLMWYKLEVMVAEKKMLAKDAEYVRGILDTTRRMTSP